MSELDILTPYYAENANVPVVPAPKCCKSAETFQTPAVVQVK